MHAHPNGFLEIHPDDARKYNINVGDMVEVASIRGRCEFPAVLTDAALPGILFIAMHDQKLERLVNFLCNDAVDPGSFEPEYKIAAVKIKRLSGPKNVADRFIISDVNATFESA